MRHKNAFDGSVVAAISIVRNDRIHSMLADDFFYLSLFISNCLIKFRNLREQTLNERT